MRKLLLGLFLVIGAHASADLVTLYMGHVTGTNHAYLTIPEGQVARVAFSHNGASSGGVSQMLIKIKFPGAGYFVSAGTAWSRDTVAPVPTYAGPCELQFIGGDHANGTSALVTVEVTPQAFDVGQTVIVPAGSSATLYFEESFDLKGWTNMMTTNYTAGTTNRFFRIRAVR